MPSLDHNVEWLRAFAFEWLYLVLLLLPLLQAACAVSAHEEVQRLAANVINATRVAQDCRRIVGSDARYQRLANHIPLGSIFDATLSQMTDQSLAGKNDVILLGLWLKDVDNCRRQIMDVTLHDFPTAMAILVVTWNKDDETFVLLATKKLVWGKAIIAIRANHAEMLATLVRQALQLSQQASAERQAELSRRVSLFNALTNLAP